MVSFNSIDFHYLWLLSTIHMLCSYFGCQYVLWTSAGPSPQFIKQQSLAEEQQPQQKQQQSGTLPHNKYRGTDNHQETMIMQSQQPWAIRLLGNIQHKNELDRKAYLFVFGFSILFTLNVAIEDLSLEWLTEMFNYVMKGLIPLVTKLIGMKLGHTYSRKLISAVYVIALGVIMSCFGPLDFVDIFNFLLDIDYMIGGFVVTLICVILAASKAVMAGEIVSGHGLLKLHPIDLISYMAPLAMIQCLLIAIVKGEISSILNRWDTEFNPLTANYYPLFVILMSGFASFMLNVSSLQVIKFTSPLTFCIAANIKQVITLLCFSTTMTITTPFNIIGIIILIIGTIKYTNAITNEKIRPSLASDYLYDTEYGDDGAEK